MGRRCASVGKVTRINAIVSSDEFKRKYPRKDPKAEFRIIDGYIDILLPSIASGAAGVGDRICSWRRTAALMLTNDQGNFRAT